MCFILLYYLSPFVNLGVAVWRLVQRDYGDAGGDIGNRSKLNAALDIFYGLILFQSLFAFYYIVIDLVDDGTSRTEKHCGLEERREDIVRIYCSETARKFRKDGGLPDNWNLIAYGVEKLQSASGDDDHLWGARVLDQLFCKDKSVRQKLLSSRISVQNLIGMIGLRGTADNVENRERAARIVAHLASDLNIAHFPDTLQCICSLLESCNKQSCESQATGPSEEPEDQNGADTVLQIKDQTEYEFGGPKELVSQGLLILEGLTQDEENCAEISKHRRLLSKITSPLSSPDFLNIVREDTMVVRMLSKSLTALSRILACPGDGATRLRQELASTTEAVSNLMAILETGSGAAQELHRQALEILTELAFDDSFKKLEFNKLLKALLCIFLDENATRLIMGKAGEALARLLPVSTAREREVNVADIISKQEAINLLTKNKRKIDNNSRFFCLCIMLDLISNSQMSPPEKSEERNFMAAMLSLAVVICNENVISREDFARSTPEDAALAEKLKYILEVNKQCTTESECLRVVKLTCQMVIAMIQAKPSCIQYFNEHNFKEALTETLGTMSEVDNCMLFAGNDHEVIKPARSLASLVKEAQELLKTAQKQGN
uniref:UNC-45/Cro1/She4 central domain-containing protein n=1 Tax=Setaria italica TaxID=4555 RepID=K3ZRN2_SETIT